MPTVPKITNAVLAAMNDPNKRLGLKVGQHNVKLGMKVPKADAQSPPRIFFNARPGKKYLVIGVDMDAPYPSFSVLGPILHWIQSGLQVQPDGVAFDLSAGNTPVVANWMAPAPPPGSSPHRYVFLLYEQPQEFDYSKHAPPRGAPLGMGKRVRWNLERFEREAGLGPILAANYFVSN